MRYPMSLLIEICLIFLFIFTPLALGTVQPWSVFLMRLVVIVALLAWFFKILLQPETNNRKTTNGKQQPGTIQLLLLLFLAVAVISTITSIYKYESIHTLANLLCYACIFFLITYHIVPPDQQPETENQQPTDHLITTILITSLILGSYGILQYWGILNLTPRVTAERICSTYYNSNHFAGYLAMVAPIPMALLLFSRFSWKSILYLALSILLTVNLALSYSWGSIGLGVGITFLVFMRVYTSKKRKLAISIAVLILISFAILGAAFMLGRTPKLPEATFASRWDHMVSFASHSVGMRIFMYRKTVPLILDNPILGTGPGTFIYAFTPYRPRGLNLFWNYAHNDYLQIASEMGLLGLSFFLIFVMISLAKGFRSMKSAFNSTEARTQRLDNTFRHHHILTLGAWAGILSALCHSILDGNLSVVPANALHFYALLGLLMASKK